MTKKLRVFDIEDPTVIHELTVDDKTGIILKWTTQIKGEMKHATI